MATVRLYATYRDAAGIKEFETSAQSVGELLEGISRAYPALYEALCDNNGELRALVKVLVNGRHIQFLNGVKTMLGDKDEVALFPPIAGG